MDDAARAASINHIVNPMQQFDIYKSDADAAYQGAPGAYSEEAALALLGTHARLMPCATLEQTFDAVMDGRAAHAIVPVESAVSGTVPNVYELLLRHDLVVTAEKIVNVDYVLVAPPETRRADVRRVLSHPLALAQCADFFRQNRGIEAVSVFDTAGAVRMTLAASDAFTAAIASRRAAEIYGAAVLAEHIQDHQDNWTRFLRLSHRDHAAPVHAAQKALIACGLRHAPGALVAALQPIAAQGLSVTKIEGRPIAGTGFEYRFVVEMIAPNGGVIPPAVYEELRRATTSFRLLGAFKTTDSTDYTDGVAAG
jgi:prephenate dehydratase